MSSVQKSEINGSQTHGESRKWMRNTFLVLLGITSVFYATILSYHNAKPVGTVAEDDALLEQCRQICLRYGLITTGDVRRDAEAYLAVVESKNLTEGLSMILTDGSFLPVESQSHRLLNQNAPEFALPDVHGFEQKLCELRKDRPVVVVFYLGYGCSHCVAQLLALNKDLHHFRELGAEIVAISSDSSEHTADKYKEYGEFNFPVLADVDYAVSKNWGVYEQETEEQPEFMKHGTFIVDRQGKLIWTAQGTEPFLDNKTLLRVIAKSQGLLPEALMSMTHETAAVITP